jgi:hypothetical protein
MGKAAHPSHARPPPTSIQVQIAPGQHAADVAQIDNGACLEYGEDYVFARDLKMCPGPEFVAP